MVDRRDQCQIGGQLCQWTHQSEVTTAHFLKGVGRRGGQNNITEDQGTREVGGS